MKPPKPTGMVPGFSVVDLACSDSFRAMTMKALVEEGVPVDSILIESLNFPYSGKILIRIEVIGRTLKTEISLPPLVQISDVKKRFYKALMNLKYQYQTLLQNHDNPYFKPPHR